MRKRGEPALKFCVTYVSDATLELFVKVQAEYEVREVNAAFSREFPSHTRSGYFRGNPKRKPAGYSALLLLAR